MAKHKRSVALFEVIQKDKRFARRGGTVYAGVDGEGKLALRR